MKKKTSTHEIWDVIKSGVAKAFQIIEKVSLTLWGVFKSILHFLLALIDNLLKALASIITSVAKIIQALALTFLALGLVGFLFVMSFYFLSKALDINASPKFEALREKVIEKYLEEASQHFEEE